MKENIMLFSLFRRIYCLDIPVLLLILTTVNTAIAWGFFLYRNYVWCRHAVQHIGYTHGHDVSALKQ